MPAISGKWLESSVVAVCASVVACVSAGKAAVAAELPGVQLTQQNLVPDCVTPSRLNRFLRDRNPRVAAQFSKIAENYARLGRRLGLRWDVAFFQMMLETDNLSFRSSNGTARDVMPEHNNFAGIGALGDGRPGDIFANQESGVQAHLEHLLHYAGVTIRSPIAERTRKVQMWRVLESWHNGFEQPITYSDVARRWAPGSSVYLKKIEGLADAFQREYCDGAAVILLHGNSRQPQIADTGWRFELSGGAPGSAGSTPPTGQPNFEAYRGSLGAGRLAEADVSSVVPPLPITAPQMSSGRMVVASVARHHRPQSQMASKAPARNTVDDQLRQLLSDRKILLRTHVGAVIPITYNSNGQMIGEAGGLGFFLGSSRDSGKWWVAGGKMCQKWRVWLDQETHCMTLKERNGTIWWRADDGKSGTAKIVAQNSASRTR
jgi:hypothetical protein